MKFEIKEFVDFLTNPDKYKKLGAKIPSGVLLSGPPGSGKTLLARATAGESKVPFYQVKGSEFMQMFVGVGSMKIRSLFAKARATAPSIVFIDEIDAVGRKRSSSDLGTQREYDNTLNQLLVEMDGFHEASRERAPVVVFAATNLPGVLDPALKRSGRFDRHIMIPLPDKIGRMEIFGVHMTPIKIDEHEKSQIASEMAERTPGMSGADIENICNESAIFAARDNSPWVQMTHFEKAFERVVCGLERKTLRLDPKELEIVAYHEAGHAIVGHFMDRVDPLIKISLIPRGKGLGYTQYKTTDKHLSSREALFQLICNLLGGRVAEMIKFNDFTSGAADDLQKVNRLAYSYVTTYGMSDELGPVSYNVNSYEQRLSETMLSKIDEEVNKLIKQAQETTRNLLLSKLDLLEEVAQTLRKKEVMNYNDFIQIVNR